MPRWCTNSSAWLSHWWPSSGYAVSFTSGCYCLADLKKKIRNGREICSLPLAERRSHMIASYSLSLSICLFVCLSPTFSFFLSLSQWESFSLCVRLHQCSPLARLCASTRGRWWPCWGHETSVAMLVTMTGERKWQCLRDRWGGSHVLSLVSPTSLSFCRLSMLHWNDKQPGRYDSWTLYRLLTDSKFEFGFCSFKLIMFYQNVTTLPYWSLRCMWI